ncbi:glycoside hydrolase family 2 TIM barrel-domain containing protein [Thalassotalea sp. PLHSN55]|uniref:glycoside hydrolase family 2 TIM barrel-domain containing protein n=1 Tax=Thalassotalea sp. PLHSN55 TaxID=3435888 RepID=UPI003F85E37C
MKIVKNLGFYITCFLLCFSAQATNIEREVDFNFDWKFTLVDSTELPSELPLKDSSWRDVRLPHDWSVEASFDESLEGATGYLPGGVGIYQKHFKTPAAPSDKNSYILFDGVYNNATFWLNGQKLGVNPYGYSPVYFDLTQWLKTDGSDNILTVHVDHSRHGDSRWYAGSGIYRNVKLITTDKLHIPIWGTFVTTPKISKEEAEINIEINVANSHKNRESVLVTTNIIDDQGHVVATDTSTARIKGMGKKVLSQSMTVANPKLWDIDQPTMYQAITTLSQKGKLVDTYTTPFGIRSLKFEAKKGFFLNGKSTLVKGVSLHHDGGLVGAAVPKEVWRRRIQLLKDAGLNAIRTTHNPFSQEFLDLCDEMGILVQNEFFDEFDYPKDKRLNMHERHDDYDTRGYAEHFQKWNKSDLTRTMLRDRNHPSVFQWSIGNEIEWTYVHYRYVTGYWNDPNDATKMDKAFWSSAPKFSPEELAQRYKNSEKGEYILADTAKKLNDWVKELDTTRPTTANLIIPQVSHVSGYADAVDIAGYSYRNSVIPWGQTHFPEKQITINENPGTWDDWKQVIQFPGVFSQFMWTGIDYMGERHKKWPHKSGWGDMLNLAGFKLQGWNYFKSVWVNEPHISLGTLPLETSGFEADELSGLAVAETKKSNRWRDSNMHWNYEKGEKILVEVTSNHSIVELFLNGESLGYRSMSEAKDRIFRWVVPYQSGVLTAKAGFTGQEIEATLETAGKVAGFTFTADKSTLKADGYDLAHLIVQLVDDKGRPIKTENAKVTFEVEGDARWLGVDSGVPENIQDFQSQSIVTAKGRTLAIIQSNRVANRITITAKIKGLDSQRLNLNLQ